MLRNDHRALRAFTGHELLATLTVAFLFAFALTFNMWGDPVFDLGVGLFNLLFVLAGMLVAVFAHEAAHKLAAAAEGYVVQIKTFTGGLVVSVFTILYSQGILPLVTPNLLEMDARPDLRLHKFRKYENAVEMAIIGAAGILGSLVAAVLFKALFLLTSVDLFMVIVLGTCLHMFLSLIPFELLNLMKLKYFEKAEQHTPGDGLHIFFYGPKTYLFALAFVLVFSGIMLFTDAFGLVVSVLIAGVAVWLWSKFMA